MGRFRLIWQLFVAFGLLTVVAIALLGLLAGAWMQQAALHAIEEGLRGKALLVDELVRGRPLDELQANLDRLHAEAGARICLLSHDGAVLAQTEHDDAERLDDHGTRPEIADAAAHGYGSATRPSAATGETYMYVARRAAAPDGPVAYVRVAMPVTAVELEVARLRGWIWVVAGLTAAIVLAVAWALVRRIVEPVQELERGAAAVAAGSFGHRVYVERKDELGTLAAAFNNMSRRLADQFTQLDQDRQQLRAVLGSMVEGVIAVDAQSHVLFANERAGELLNFSAAQAAQRKLWEVVRHRPVHDLVHQVLTSHNGQTATLDATGFADRSLTVHAARLPGVPVRGAVLVFHDITELRRLERVRQEFVANVSHELKTPLSVIVACVETLQSGAIEDLDNRGRFLERIGIQAHRLLSLIVDLLSLARIESGTEVLQPQAVPVEEVVRSCVDRHAERTRGRNQRLEAVPPARQPEGGVVAWADEDALNHILDNLVDNAIKYTPAQGTIQLHWWQTDGSCVIEVRDTGIGIPETELPRVFERFYRVDRARSRELGGTGLGLSIVKHLTQAMGGSVAASSEPERGSTFTITLPAGAPAG
jgi:two-component system phosphate regulon sensor histidine kinase PhoR